MGLVLLRSYPREGVDGEINEYYDVVDGQQRLTTLFEYIEGTDKWIHTVPKKYRGSFCKYRDLSQTKQDKIDEYILHILAIRIFGTTR